MANKNSENSSDAPKAEQKKVEINGKEYPVHVPDVSNKVKPARDPKPAKLPDIDVVWIPMRGHPPDRSVSLGKPFLMSIMPNVKFSMPGQDAKLLACAFPKNLKIWSDDGEHIDFPSVKAAEKAELDKESQPQQETGAKKK